MKRIIYIIMALVLLVGCTAEPRINTSTDENMKASTAKVRESLSEAQKAKFDEALKVMTFSNIDLKDIYTKRAEAEGYLEAKMKEPLNGKTGPEVIAAAEAVLKERREKAQALEEISEEEIDCDNLYIKHPTIKNPYKERMVYPYLPKELKELADEFGCEHKFKWNVKTACYFKDKPFYAYGYLPGKKEDSAVFWCKKEINNRMKNLLMVYHRNEKPESYNCPDYYITRDTPRPLTIYDASDEYYKGYIEHHRGEGVTVPNNGIYSGLEVGGLYYCYKGRWHFVGLD